MVSAICLLLGALIGFGAVKSGTFREGGGLVLLFICVVAIIAAAVLGALSPLFPAAIAVWTGRVALFCVAFAVSVFIADR